MEKFCEYGVSIVEHEVNIATKHNKNTFFIIALFYVVYEV